MKNKLIDLNNHLFMQLERLNEDDLTEEQLETEIRRSKAIAQVGAQINETMRIVIEAAKAQSELYGDDEAQRNILQITGNK